MAILHMSEISKSFFGVEVLHSVHLDVEKGNAEISFTNDDNYLNCNLELEEKKLLKTHCSTKLANNLASLV